MLWNICSMVLYLFLFGVLNHVCPKILHLYLMQKFLKDDGTILPFVFQFPSIAQIWLTDAVLPQASMIFFSPQLRPETSRNHQRSAFTIIDTKSAKG
jgi:hypothetical protein